MSNTPLHTSTLAYLNKTTNTSPKANIAKSESLEPNNPKMSQASNSSQDRKKQPVKVEADIRFKIKNPSSTKKIDSLQMNMKNVSISKPKSTSVAIGNKIGKPTEYVKISQPVRPSNVKRSLIASDLKANGVPIQHNQYQVETELSQNKTNPDFDQKIKDDNETDTNTHNKRPAESSEMKRQSDNEECNPKFNTNNDQSAKSSEQMNSKRNSIVSLDDNQTNTGSDKFATACDSDTTGRLCDLVGQTNEQDDSESNDIDFGTLIIRSDRMPIGSLINTDELFQSTLETPFEEAEQLLVESFTNHVQAFIQPVESSEPSNLMLCQYEKVELAQASVVTKVIEESSPINETDSVIIEMPIEKQGEEDDPLGDSSKSIPIETDKSSLDADGQSLSEPRSIKQDEIGSDDVYFCNIVSGTEPVDSKLYTSDKPIAKHFVSSCNQKSSDATILPAETDPTTYRYLKSTRSESTKKTAAAATTSLIKSKSISMGQIKTRKRHTKSNISDSTVDDRIADQLCLESATLNTDNTNDESHVAEADSAQVPLQTVSSQKLVEPLQIDVASMEQSVPKTPSTLNCNRKSINNDNKSDEFIYIPKKLIYQHEDSSNIQCNDTVLLDKSIESIYVMIKLRSDNLNLN